jgi:V/A-type H+-transporting ATPase subunit I
VSIIPLQKVTFVGLTPDKEKVLSGLQEHGCLDLIPLGDSEEMKPPDGSLQRSREVFRFLLSSPRQDRPVMSSERFDPVRVEQDALALMSALQELQEERDAIARRIELMRPWGDFSFARLDDMGGLRLWFYIIPRKEMNRIRTRPEPWEVVRIDALRAYVAVVSPEEPEGMPVPRMRLGNRTRRELEERFEAVERAIEEKRAERAYLTRWNVLYARSLCLLEDEESRRGAAQKTLDNQTVFALQGWAPSANVPALKKYAAAGGMVFEARPPSRADTPPTLLRNPPVMSSGEDLVTFYMTPGYWTWDPSAIVFVSFAVFFAMILSDAGYAAVLGCILLVLWRKLGKTAGLKRYRHLAAAIVCVSLIFGIMAGSYFGVTPPAGSFFARCRVIDIQNADLMMAVSVVVGALHVMLGCLMDARRHGLRQEALPSVGWAGMVAGGLGIAGAAVLHNGLLMRFSAGSAVIGALLVVIFSGVGEKPMARLMTGLIALTKVTGAFGDVLSYLRLFALGLATASLAVSFNDMARGIAASLPHLGLILALAVLLFGHALNFLLALASCVIHGLRLNVIEFFNWGLKEEGRLFQHFKRKEQYLWKH